MKLKKSLSLLLAFVLILPAGSALAYNEEFDQEIQEPKNKIIEVESKNDEIEITPRAGIYDVILLEDSYRGEKFWYTGKSEGGKYGSCWVYYKGREHTFWGKYIYMGTIPH